MVARRRPRRRNPTRDLEPLLVPRGEVRQAPPMTLARGLDYGARLPLPLALVAQDLAARGALVALLATDWGAPGDALIGWDLLVTLPQPASSTLEDALRAEGFRTYKDPTRRRWYRELDD